MSIAPDLTLRLILEHKHPFLGFIEEMDRNPTDSRLPVAFYNRRIAETLHGLAGTDRQRARDALALPNLYRNGFLLDWSKKDGTLTFKPWLVEMLRHLDSLRLRELSDKDLDHLRSQLADVVDQIENKSIPRLRGDRDFTELLCLMYDTLNTVNDRLQQSVRSLDAKSRHLSEILESDEVMTLDRSRQMREALEQVHRLYERHIKPMLQFIDEKQDYKDRKNPMALIESMVEHMDLMGFPGDAGRITNTQISILAHAKGVKAIARLLTRYIRQDQEERYRYNRVEEHFNIVLAACRSTLHDGNLRTKFVPSDHPAFDAGRPFLGMKAHQQAARTPFSWGDRDRYDKYLTEKVRSYRESTLKRLADADLAGQAADIRFGEVERQQQARADRDARIQQILAAMTGFDAMQPLKDTHQALHDHLQAHLNAYSLSDLVEAHTILQSRERARLRYHAGLKELTHAGYRLRYLPCAMEAR
jgi:hypothetical protein